MAPDKVDAQKCEVVRERNVQGGRISIDLVTEHVNHNERGNTHDHSCDDSDDDQIDHVRGFHLGAMIVCPSPPSSCLNADAVGYC